MGSWLSLLLWLWRKPGLPDAEPLLASACAAEGCIRARLALVHDHPARRTGHAATLYALALTIGCPCITARRSRVI